MEALLGSLGAMGDAPARNHICSDAEDLQNQLRSLVASKSSDTRAEFISTAFEFRYNAVFRIPVEHEASGGDPVLQLQPPSIRAVNASEAVVNQPTDDPALQRLVAKHIVNTIAAADGSAWNVRQVSRGAQGWVFAYQCKHSLQAWLRQQGKNPGRPPIAAFHASVGQDPINMSRPAFDCRGSVSIEFATSTKAIVVKYDHTPLHKSVGELADRLTHVPPPPVINGNHVANKSAKAKRPPPAEGEEGRHKKKAKGKSKAAAAAEDGSEDATNVNNTVTPSREPEATEQASQSAAPAPLIVSQAEATRRKCVAKDLLNGRGVDPATLSSEQMDIFANQAPHLQELSLEMLAKYGAERLRIVHPGEKDQAASADSTPAQQSTTVQAAAAPSTESTPVDSDTPSKKKAQRKETDTEPTNTPAAATGEAPAPENGGIATTSSTLERLPGQRKTRGKCDTCRKREVQCTKEHPECSVCQQAGETCVYLPPKARRKSEKVDLVDEEEDADESVVGEREGQAEPPVPAVQPPHISLPAFQADEVIQAAQAAHAAHVAHAAQPAQVAAAQAAHAHHESGTAQAAPSQTAYAPYMDETTPAQATPASHVNETTQAVPASAAASVPAHRTRSAQAPAVDVDNDEFVPDPNILSGPIEQSVAQAQARSYSSLHPPEVTYTTQSPETTYANMALSETARHANQAIANLTFPPNQFHWETSQAAPSLTFPSATQSAAPTQQGSVYTQPAAQAQSQPAAKNMTAAARQGNRHSLPLGPGAQRAEPGDATKWQSTQGWKQQAPQSPSAPAPSSTNSMAVAHPQAPQQRPRSRASGDSVDLQAADTMQAAVMLAQAASQRRAPQSSVMNRSPYQSTVQKPNPRTQSGQGQRSQSHTPVTQTAVSPPQLPPYASATPTPNSAPTYDSFAHYSGNIHNQYSGTATAGDSSSRVPYEASTYRTQAPSAYTTPSFDYSRSTAADSLHHALNDASGYGSSTNGNAHWTMQPGGSHSSVRAHDYNTEASQTPPPNMYDGGRSSTRQGTQASYGHQSQSAAYGSYPSPQPTATNQQQNQKWYGLAAAHNNATGPSSYSGTAKIHDSYGDAGATAQAGSYLGHRPFENYGQGYTGSDDQALYDLLRVSDNGN